ncbi:MAG: CAP domain-containing protein [Syntrophorhabdales bacterium]|jgi:uncharacterized protein YkwD
MADHRHGWYLLAGVLVLACAVAFLIAAALWPKSPGASPDRTAISSSGRPLEEEDLSRDAIIRLTNDVRAGAGLAVLGENGLLDAIADERATDMLEKQYFAHISPSGEQASDIAQRIGYRYRTIAENIASGMFLTNRKIIDGWMQSPGHRKNILLPEVREMGASVIKGMMQGQETWVSVQIFGLQSLPETERPCPSPSRSLTDGIDAGKAELGGLAERLSSLRRELDAEKDSIELDRINAEGDGGAMRDLASKIRAYNAKAAGYNQSLTEMKAKEKAVGALIEEYNKAVREYKDCRAAD